MFLLITLSKFIAKLISAENIYKNHISKKQFSSQMIMQFKLSIFECKQKVFLDKVKN